MARLSGLPDDVLPHFASAALVTVDVQCDVLDGGPFEVRGTSHALAPMAALARRFRDQSLPIVHVVRLYLADGSNADPVRRSLVAAGGPLLRPGTAGSQIAPGLLPERAPTLDPELLLAGGMQTLGDNEVATYKARWGAFYGTDLEAHLRGAGIDTLVVCGANFPNCPRTTVYEASERDFRVVVVEDALSGLYDKGAAELRAIGVALMPAAEVERAVEATTAGLSQR
jgi:nicotinamidase-related amidase